jgi:hypothetical protein
MHLVRTQLYVHLTVLPKSMVRFAGLNCYTLLLTKEVFIINSLPCVQVVIMDLDGMVVRLVTSCSMYNVLSLFGLCLSRSVVTRLRVTIFIVHTSAIEHSFA